MVKIEFKDSNDVDYIVSVPVINREKPTVLRMWVAYELGNRTSFYDNSRIERGYYLYFSFEESSTEDYPTRCLTMDGENCRMLLGSVERKAQGWTRVFSDLAADVLEIVLEERFAGMKLDWEKIRYSVWSGNGSGVGLYSEFYTIFFPEESWIMKRTDNT